MEDNTVKKILVSVKRVVDPYVNVRVKADESGVETANTKMSMNPFDEIALEEALRLKEAGMTEEVIAVSIGSQATQETLRTALAIGADRAILVESDQDLEPLNVAKVLQKLVEKEQPFCLLMGKQSIDGDHNQTGQMLAGLLSWSQATFASKVIIEGEQAIVTREVDGGLETIAVTLPAVITTDLRLNEPRYASLPNIMKAKQKPIDKIPLADLSADIKTHTEILKVQTPPERSAGVILDSAQDLVKKLREEAKVLS